MLTLNWTLYDEDDGCAALSGAQVDIWHAAPDGKYSDEAVEGTSGKKYLHHDDVDRHHGRGQAGLDQVSRARRSAPACCT